MGSKVSVDSLMFGFRKLSIGEVVGELSAGEIFAELGMCYGMGITISVWRSVFFCYSYCVFFVFFVVVAVVVDIVVVDPRNLLLRFGQNLGQW